MFGAYVTLNNMNQIMIANNLMHVRGELKGETFHWSRIYEALSLIKIKQGFLVLRPEDNIAYIYFKDKEVTQYFSLTNFMPTLYDFLKLGIMTEVLLDEVNVKDRVDRLESNE